MNKSGVYNLAVKWPELAILTNQKSHLKYNLEPLKGSDETLFST